MNHAVRWRKAWNRGFLFATFPSPDPCGRRRPSLALDGRQLFSKGTEYSNALPLSDITPPLPRLCRFLRYLLPISNPLPALQRPTVAFTLRLDLAGWGAVIQERRQFQVPEPEEANIDTDGIDMPRASVVLEWHDILRASLSRDRV